MRRPFLVAAFLAVALIAVLYAKWQLDTAIKEGKFAETDADTAEEGATGAGENDQPQTIDIGIAQDPAVEARGTMHHASEGASKTDVMATLAQARESFKSKPAVTDEATKDPHSTPPTIIQAAETLGKILTLEKQNPAYKPEFQAFYLECAELKDNLTVTRVQCLENYVKSRELNSSDEEALVSKMDPAVQQIYKEIKR